MSILNLLKAGDTSRWLGSLIAAVIHMYVSGHKGWKFVGRDVNVLE